MTADSLGYFILIEVFITIESYNQEGLKGMDQNK